MYHSERETFCAVPTVPLSMELAIKGYDWLRDTVGESGGAVYHLHGKPGAHDLFLKHGRDGFAQQIYDEAARLRWLDGRLPTPDIRQFIGTADEAWLLMTAVEGKTAYQLLEAQDQDPFPIVDAIAAFLRQLHALPVDECPFISAWPLRMAQARQRIDAGLVDVEDFDDVRSGWSAEMVWNRLLELTPASPVLVVTHGDYSLDNLLIDANGTVGCIDLGRAGLADRYQDLAIIWNCLEEFGADLQKRFVVQYGLDRFDPQKLEFHLLLDELF